MIKDLYLVPDQLSTTALHHLLIKYNRFCSFELCDLILSVFYYLYNDFKPNLTTLLSVPCAQPQASVVASEVPSRLDSEKVTTPQEGRFPGEKRVATKKPDVQSSLLPPEASEAKKKPIGAVSLFGGIDVLAKKTSKSPLDELDGEDDILSKDSRVEKEKGEKEEQDIKVKNKTLSLFDEEDDDWTAPISIPSSKTDSQNILKVCVLLF